MQKARHRSIIAFLCGVLLFGFAPVRAAEITIYGILIDGLHQADGQGEYDRTIDSLRPAIPLPFKVEVVPPARAFAAFEKCTACCISPANQNPEFYDYQDGYLATDPMNVAKIYIWTPPGSAAVSDLAALEGKKIVARHGMPYGKTIESTLSLERVQTIEAAIRMIKAGRADAMIEYVPDAYTEFSNLGMDPFPHAQDRPVVEHNDSLLCRKSGETEAFVDAFNAALAAKSSP